MTKLSRNQEILIEFRTVLRSEGLCEAVRLLNVATSYRFSAVYAFQGDVLRNVCLVDKLDPSASPASDLPIEESYCVFIKRTSKAFGLEHAARDIRVEGHPKRDSILSYYGIPLLGDAGHLLGTACHFDTVPVPLSEEVVSLLDSVAPLLAEELTRAADK